MKIELFVFAIHWCWLKSCVKRHTQKCASMYSINGFQSSQFSKMYHLHNSSYCLHFRFDCCFCCDTDIIGFIATDCCMPVCVLLEETEAR